MLNPGKKIRASRDKKKNSEQQTIPPPLPFKLNGWSLR